MPKKKVKGPKTAKQARYFGYLAGKGVGWAKDKLRGKKMPKGSRAGGGRKRK